jgi:hypothetical protein
MFVPIHVEPDVAASLASIMVRIVLSSHNPTGYNATLSYRCPTLCSPLHVCSILAHHSKTISCTPTHLACLSSHKGWLPHPFECGDVHKTHLCHGIMERGPVVLVLLKRLPGHQGDSLPA